MTKIGDGSFEYCSNLPSIVIPDKITEIPTPAFIGCQNLRSVQFGAGVREIDGSAFSQCQSLQEITIAPENDWFSVGEHSVLYSKDYTSLVVFPGGYEETSCTLPDTVNTIKETSFCSSKNLTSVTVPEGVSTIECLTFKDCVLLKEILILNPNCMLNGNFCMIFNIKDTVL